MGHITKIAAVENATAIWEYDPELYDNRVLGGSLDVIAAVRTIAIKVSFPFPCLNPFTETHPNKIQASGQRIEYFEKVQINCNINEPLRIPLHSNVRWGSAYNMLKRTFQLRLVSRNSFYHLLYANLNSPSTVFLKRLILCSDLSRQCAAMDVW